MTPRQRVLAGGSLERWRCIKFHLQRVKRNDKALAQLLSAGNFVENI